MDKKETRKNTMISEGYSFFKIDAIKIRRVMQIINDLVGSYFKNLRILDLGCAGGAYSLEAGLRGARVVGVDGRDLRMKYGIEEAKKLNLSNVAFELEDIRNLSKDKFGEFDVILFLGVLYHFDVPDVFHVLSNLYQMCSGFMIVDTHISLVSDISAEYEGRVYHGCDYVETGGDVSSLNNAKSFWFTRESLIKLMNDVGFTSVYECCVPLEPMKPKDRLTLVALKRDKVKVLTYPWINDMSEYEIKVEARNESRCCDH